MKIFLFKPLKKQFIDKETEALGEVRNFAQGDKNFLSVCLHSSYS